MNFIKDYIANKKKKRSDAKQGIVKEKPLPLGFRLNGLVTLDNTSFILSEELDWFPGVSNTVVATGKLNLFGDDFFRIYLASTEDNDSFIQINSEGTEAILFATIFEVEPQDEHEWADWLEENTGTLGGKTIETPDGEEYDRVWGSDKAWWAEPIDYVESVTASEEQTDIESYESEVQSMLFQRTLASGEIEFLLASVEDGKSIFVYKGFAVSPASFTVV